MKGRQDRRIIRNEHGGSLVEFIIIAPLLFIILFGIIEFGILIYDKAMITNASREGARAGIIFIDPRTSVPEIKQKVKNYCIDPESLKTRLISLGTESTFGDANIVVDPLDTEGALPGDPLTVTVNYPYQFLVLSNIIAFFWEDFNGTINLKSVTIMRFE